MADVQPGVGRHGTGGEPCGPAADDEEVVALALRVTVAERRSSPTHLGIGGIVVPSVLL